MNTRVMSTRRLALTLLVAGLAVWSTAYAAENPERPLNPAEDTLINLVQWTEAEGGNDHWYALIALELTWVEADSLAGTTLRDDNVGHLATILSAAENEFIRTRVTAGTSQPGILNLFWLGGTDEEGDWTWTTGEYFAYLNWAAGEPSSPGIETALCMWGEDGTGPDGTWNDAQANHTGNRWWAVIEWGIDECCGLYTGGYTGNTDCDPAGKRNLADITRMIDRIYISKQPLCCEENGNVNGDIENKIGLADITKLIDHVYVSRSETARCR